MKFWFVFVAKPVYVFASSAQSLNGELICNYAICNIINRDLTGGQCHGMLVFAACQPVNTMIKFATKFFGQYLV